MSEHTSYRVRRIWRRRGVALAAGLAAFVALSAAALIAKHYKREAAARALLRQATQYEQHQDYLAAARCLEEYLYIDPLDDLQRVRLARLSARAAHTRETRDQAIQHLYRAIGVGLAEQETGLRERLAELLEANDYYVEAEVAANKLLDAHPNHAEALRIRAVALARQYQNGALRHVIPGQLPIVVWLERARACNPRDVEVAVLTAEAYRTTEHFLAADRRLPELRRHVLADTCLNELVALRRDAAAHFARYEYRRKWGLPGANDDLEEAARLAPDDAQILHAMGHEARRAALHQWARVPHLEAAPPPSPRETLLAELHHRDWPTLRWVHKALEENHRGERPAPPNYQTALIQSRVFAMRGEYDLAEETLSASLGQASEVQRRQAERELYQFQMAQGNFDEARKLLAAMVRQSPENTQLLESTAEFDVEHRWFDDISWLKEGEAEEWSW